MGRKLLLMFGLAALLSALTGCVISKNRSAEELKQIEAEAEAKQRAEIESDAQRIKAPEWYYRNRTIVDVGPGYNSYMVPINWLHINLLLLGLFMYPLSGVLLISTRPGADLLEWFNPDSYGPNREEPALLFPFFAPVVAELGGVALGLLSRVVFQSATGDYYVPQGVFAVGLHIIFMFAIPVYVMISWLRPERYRAFQSEESAPPPRRGGIGRKMFKAFLAALAGALGTQVAGLIWGAFCLAGAAAIAAIWD